MALILRGYYLGLTIQIMPMMERGYPRLAGGFMISGKGSVMPQP